MGSAKSKTVCIRMSDIATTNCNAGISSAIVDFYIRHIQHTTSINESFMYSAVDSQLIQHRKVFSKYIQLLANEAAEKKLQIFPVRLPDQWHWIAVCFIIEPKRLSYFTMDSQDTSHPIGKFISFVRYLSLMLNKKIEENEIEVLYCKVINQGGNADCGVMMLQNIEAIAKLDVKQTQRDLRQGDAFLCEADPVSMRRRIRQLIHQKNL